MFGTPTFDSPLTYLGVLLLTVGIYLTLSGLGILKIEKYTTPEGVKSWGVGSILILIGLVLLFVLPGYQTSNGSQQEIGIIECQDDPNVGIVNANTQIILTWGWNEISTEAKRNELASVSSFIVEVDGKTQNPNDFKAIYRSTDAVIWKTNLGRFSPGFHTVKLTRLLSQDYTDEANTLPAGRQPTETCELTVK